MEAMRMALTTAKMYFLISSKAKDSRAMINNIHSRAYLVDSCLLDLAAADVISLKDNRIIINEVLPHSLYFLNSFMDVVIRNKDDDIDTVIAKILQNVGVIEHTYLALGEEFTEDGNVIEKKKGIIHKVRTFVPQHKTNAEIIDNISSQMLGTRPMSINVFCLTEILVLSRQLRIYFRGRERKAIKNRLLRLEKHPEYAKVFELSKEFEIHMKKVTNLIAKETPSSYINL